MESIFIAGIVCYVQARLRASLVSLALLQGPLSCCKSWPNVICWIIYWMLFLE